MLNPILAQRLIDWEWLSDRVHLDGTDFLVSSIFHAHSPVKFTLSTGEEMRIGKRGWRKERMRILVITAEQKAAWALKEELESKRYEAMTAHSAEEGFYLLSTGRFDLVLLDPMLPGRDGVELLMVLRRSGIKTPVLFHSPEDLYMDARRIVALCQAMEAGSPGEWPNVLAVKNSEARPGTGTGLPLKAHCIHSQGNPG